MPHFLPAIDSAIFDLRPDFRAVSIHAEGMVNPAENADVAAALAAACAAPCAAPWAEAHREAWREAYRGFGAKPQRTPCSAEALLKRVLRDGTLPSVNAVVDLYNAVSLRFAIPVGGENALAYAGAPRLIRATGAERFDTMQAGSPVTEHPDRGEVVWCDDEGVTCRRWNWRQGARTRIEPDSTDMWFILESLGAMPEDALIQARAELVSGLTSLSPAAWIETFLISREGSENLD